MLRVFNIRYMSALKVNVGLTEVASPGKQETVRSFSYCSILICPFEITSFFTKSKYNSLCRMTKT